MVEEEEADSWQGGGADVGESIGGDQLGAGLEGDGLDDGPYEDDTISLQEDLSEYEMRVRDAHLEAMEELRRRVEEERGNAAAALRYESHVEYRKWQVAVEREVLRDMIAELA